jgi:hypothetical protein
VDRRAGARDPGDRGDAVAMWHGPSGQMGLCVRGVDVLAVRGYHPPCLRWKTSGWRTAPLSVPAFT